MLAFGIVISFSKKSKSWGFRLLLVGSFGWFLVFLVFCFAMRGLLVYRRLFSLRSCLIGWIWGVCGLLFVLFGRGWFSILFLFVADCRGGWFGCCFCFFLGVRCFVGVVFSFSDGFA